ncbi:MAG TPA: hypothetical protein VGQ81_11405 [Acidobacteriota bacterium]|jgi:hypothetical protein|nr:hypothetical protein [Acidobacteriota bacterium]
MKKWIASIFVLMLSLTFAIPQQTPAKAETKQQNPNEPPVVPRIYEIKARRVEEIAELIQGMYDIRVTINRNLNALTIRINESMHSAISELIRKYDVPAKMVEFQFYILKANRSGTGVKDGLPEKIRRVISDIASLTRYQNFELLDTPFIRASEGREASLSGKGIFYYRIELGRVGVVSPLQSMKSSSESQYQIRVDNLGVWFSQATVDGQGKISSRDIGGVRTDISLADGEMAVLGASQLSEETKNAGDAVITVLSAKVLR